MKKLIFLELWIVWVTFTKMEFVELLVNLLGFPNDVVKIVARYYTRLCCITCDPWEEFRRVISNPYADRAVAMTRVRMGLYCGDCGLVDIISRTCDERFRRGVAGIIVSYYSRTTCMVCDPYENGKKLLPGLRVRDRNFVCHKCDRCNCCNLQVRCRSPYCECNLYGCKCT